MGRPFKCIGLVGIPRKLETIETHQVLYDWLVNLVLKF